MLNPNDLKPGDRISFDGVIVTVEEPRRSIYPQDYVRLTMPDGKAQLVQHNFLQFGTVIQLPYEPKVGDHVERNGEPGSVYRVTRLWTTKNEFKMAELNGDECVGWEKLRFVWSPDKQ